MHLQERNNFAKLSPIILDEERRMNKAEFVSAMAAHGAMAKKDAEHFLSIFADTLRNSLQKDPRIALRGIGIFPIEERAARPGRKPATGQEIQIPAKKVVKFKTAKEIADAVAQ